MFQDRKEAGQKLGAALLSHKGQDCVVLALPRGGLPVAAEVATMLGAPLDIILVRKIGCPSQPELAIGAVVDGPAPIVVRNEDVIALAGTSKAEFDRVCAEERKENERRRKLYLGDRPPLSVKGRVAIVVDDGLATGATMRAALKATRAQGPSKLIMAVPVAPPDTLASLRPETDETVCLESREDFFAVGAFYRHFGQTSDEEVITILAAAAKPKPVVPEAGAKVAAPPPPPAPKPPAPKPPTPKPPTPTPQVPLPAQQPLAPVQALQPSPAQEPAPTEKAEPAPHTQGAPSTPSHK